MRATNRNVAPPPRGGDDGPPTTRRVGRAFLAVVVVAAALWTLRAFLPALVWAAVFAIALWPLYRRLAHALPQRGARVAMPLALTLLVGLVVLAPLVYAAVALARESATIVDFLNEARETGVPAPDWLMQLPGIGHPLGEWWRNNLADPGAARALLGRINTHLLARSAREYGGQVVHRVTLFGFTLLTLFFLLRDGPLLSRQLLDLSNRVLGEGGERVGQHMIAAVHGTVNGLVLVGLAEGAVMAVAYLVAGLPHVVPVALLTGILAVIPFGAPVVFGGASLYLMAAGKLAVGIAVFAFGAVVVFFADHFIRPVLIGGATRLPFLLVLLGILGGLESWGLLGLFLGPAIMAALVSLWRDWTGAAPHEPGRAARH
jgi:predicted PurR-regulated permease PerM